MSYGHFLFGMNKYSFPFGGTMNVMFQSKYLNKHLKRFGFLFIIGILCDIMCDYVQLFIPEFLGEMVEIVANISHPALNDIAHIVKGLVIVAIALMVGRMLWRFTIIYSSSRIESALRHDMFLKAERLSQRYYHENKAGTIMAWFSTDLEAIEEYVGWGTIMTVDAIFLLGLTVFKMIKLDLVLSIITIIPMVTLIIWGAKVEKTMSNKWDERQKAFDKLYDFAQENFMGIRVIKAFVKEKQEMLAFSKVAKENQEKNLDFSKVSITFDVYIEVIIAVIITIILGAGSYFVYRNAIGNPLTIFGDTITLTAGTLTTFIGYADTLIWPMIAMGQIIQMRSRFKASMDRVAHFLDEDEEVCSSKNAVELKGCKGKITFKNFSFGYPGTKKHSLDNISFEIQPGEMVGVVGKVGSGKTTLVNSLLRLYNIEKNKIFIDDIDLMDINIVNLRDNIAYVPQDNFLFSDNIKNNIAFSNRKAKFEDIKRAAEFADIDENIMDFNEGYDTLTGERGVTLSGGQKQRISIARAYLKDAPIMILDDSVSAVDVKTEETILSNIKEKRSGKTTIIIASRVSTVAHLDKIVVFNKGQIEAFDTPTKLLEISPTYKKMVYLQKLESELKNG